MYRASLKNRVLKDERESTEILLKKAKNAAFKFLSYRSHCIHELTTKLHKKGFSQEIISSVIDDFKKKGYLDDRIFAVQWIESRSRGKSLGSLRLREELLQRGVEKSLVNDVLKEGLLEDEEKEIALMAAKKKRALLKSIDPVAAKRRIYGYLFRRGYSMNTIEYVLKQLNINGMKEREYCR